MMVEIDVAQTIHGLSYFMLGIGMLSGIVSLFVNKPEDKVIDQLYGILSILGAVALKYMGW